LFYRLIDEPLGQFLTGTLLALRAVVNLSVDDTGSHGASLIDELLSHTSIKKNLSRLQSEAKVPEPLIAEYLLVQGI
jgi:hypothetical protein